MVVQPETKDGPRRILWRSFCSDPVVSFLDTKGVRVAGGFANGFGDSSAARDLLSRHMPHASETDLSTFVVGWEQAKLEIDLDVYWHLS